MVGEEFTRMLCTPLLPAVQKSLLKSGGEGEIVELCSKIDVPTLIMWGQQDKVCTLFLLRNCRPENIIIRLTKN